MAKSEQGIPLIGPILNKLIGSRNDRFVKRYTQRVEQISAESDHFTAMTDEQIRGVFLDLRSKHDAGAKEDEILVSAFAAAREAMDRAVGLRQAFNPEQKFDASRLQGPMRDLYDTVSSEMRALPLLQPKTYVPMEGGGVTSEGDVVPDTEDHFLGSTELIPGWRRHPVPTELYQAIRDLYPVSRPPFRARPFDVQLIGGMVLAQGKIAEMKTGEGKTIVAPLAAFLAACQRNKVHVVTVNDYLVQRDRDWTFPFFWALGLTVGAIHPAHSQPEDVKRLMYRCDVVYGTTAEFGFDYLRDNMKRSAEQQVQRLREFAIVDEVDSVLIDEARTPLIISGLAHEHQPRYELGDRLARQLVEKQKPWQAKEDEVTRCKELVKGLEGDIRQARDKGEVPALTQRLSDARARLPELERERDQFTQYYEVEMDRKSAHLTHEGISEAQRLAAIGSFYIPQNIDVPHLLAQAVRAHVVYQRDRDYIVMDVPDRNTGKTEPSVVIVDTNTGRPMIGRQWSDGLHQAVEFKERVPVKAETQTVASVTIQNFFKMYKNLSGMTGTADTEAQEFRDIYGLDVVTIPTNKPVIRGDYDDLMFMREKDKWDSLVDEIKNFHDVGRPILVGTTSVEKSELLSRLLSKKHQVRHEVLNAKQHEREANVVEDAGQLGSVMIATNMAGRGTDIKLAALSRETMIEHWLKRGIAGKGLRPESTDQELRENVYRKVAVTELKDDGLKKRDIEQMPFEELELTLLRVWAFKYTWAGDKRIENSTPDELRVMLTEGGRFAIHDIRWYENIEDMGGLHVIGTERHESRRIDNQLRGRAGRQGDHGSSRFYVSLEDDLMKMFAGETTQKLLSRMGMKEGDAIEHSWLSKNIERAQRKVEERNFQVRKNILEYDEIMEVQRQTFYGLRQRVIDGRDVKGLIFGYIGEAVAAACEEYLDTEYPAACAAEYAKEQLGVSILPEQLRNRDADELEASIRRLAKDDAQQTIDVTLGEYLPTEGSDVAVDFDSAGLVEWAKSTFGVEIDVGELREGGSAERRRVQTMLEAAAFERIETTELPQLGAYTESDYGARRLSEWAQKKFGVLVPSEEIVAAVESETKRPEDLIMTQVRDVYRKREIEYPVDYAIEMTRVIAQQDPGAAFEQLARWARTRFGGSWSPDEIRMVPPQKIRERFLGESEKFVDEDRLRSAIAEALTCDTDEKLEAHLRERYEAMLPEHMRFLEGKERSNAIRARVETILRNELLFFERTVLLEQFDTAWKDHLYAMDQMRDSINFRAFSQQDPRIAFKREGSQLFKDMLGGIRERVTDVIFRARISPASAFQNAAGASGRPGVGGGARGPVGQGGPGRPGAFGPGGGGRPAVAAATNAFPASGGAQASARVPGEGDAPAQGGDSTGTDAGAADVDRAAFEADKGKPRIR